jgi:heme/copper-type cytochrome/quinol oxidase subunit 2
VKIIQANSRAGDTWSRVREFVRKPWFIAIMGGILWIVLLVVVLLLYRRRRRNRRQLKQKRRE